MEKVITALALAALFTPVIAAAQTDPTDRKSRADSAPSYCVQGDTSPACQQAMVYDRSRLRPNPGSLDGERAIDNPNPPATGDLGSYGAGADSGKRASGG